MSIVYVVVKPVREYENFPPFIAASSLILVGQIYLTEFSMSSHFHLIERSQEAHPDPTNFTLLLVGLDAPLSVKLDILYIQESINDPFNLQAKRNRDGPLWWAFHSVNTHNALRLSLSP